MFHKTNGTNEKVVPQGFILALKKIHFYHLPPQNQGKPQFLGVFHGFFKNV